MAYPTTEELAARLRTAHDDPALAGISAAWQAFIDSLPLTDIPDAIRNEAYVRACGYSLDQPAAAAGTSYADAWRNSGAAAITNRWRKRSAGVIDRAGETTSSSSSSSDTGVDQTARNAAASAIAAAQRAQGTADANAEDIETVRGVAASNAGKLMPPNNAEADAATSTAIRGWSAAFIRRVVESIVPEWARGSESPTADGGISEARAKQIADNSANTAVENGVQIPARAAPGNAINGKQQYFAADFYAPDGEAGWALTVQPNESVAWSNEQALLRRDGDEFATYSVATSAELAAALAAHDKLNVGAVIACTAKFSQGGTDFEDGQRYYVAPHHVDVANMVLISDSGGSELTTAQQIALLTITTDPAVIAYATADEFEDQIKAIGVSIPNSELLTGDVWVETWLSGQRGTTGAGSASGSRIKWTPSASGISSVLFTDAIAESIASSAISAKDNNIELRFRFYDAAIAGNEIERTGVNIPVVKLPADGEETATLIWDAANPTDFATHDLTDAEKARLFKAKRVDFAISTSGNIGLVSVDLAIAKKVLPDFAAASVEHNFLAPEIFASSTRSASAYVSIYPSPRAPQVGIIDQSVVVTKIQAWIVE